MNTTIDSAGRLVVPKELRRQAQVKPGMLSRFGSVKAASRSSQRRSKSTLSGEGVWWSLFLGRA
jgi:bifunctional DNA-binding transcriptional regulator/antitoxin component of YhaV-PrlF toxin-antitoxin module